MAIDRSELFKQLRGEVVKAGQATKELETEFEQNSSQESLRDLLKVISRAEVKVRGGGNLEESDKGEILAAFLSASSFLEGKYPNLERIEDLIQQLGHPPGDVLGGGEPPEPGGPQEPEALSNPEKITDQIKTFLGFVHEIRTKYFEDFLEGIFTIPPKKKDDPNNTGTDPYSQEHLQKTADFIAEIGKDTPEARRLRIETERQLLMVMVVLFDNKNDANIDSKSWGDIQIPTGGYTPQNSKNFLPLPHDKETTDTSAQGVLGNLPEPLKKFAEERIVPGLKSKTGISFALGEYKNLVADRGNASIANFLTYSRGKEIDKFLFTANLTSVGAESGAVSQAEKKQEILELHRTDVHGDLIRLASSLVDILFSDNGAVVDTTYDVNLKAVVVPKVGSGITKKSDGEVIGGKTNAARQEIIRLEVKRAYLAYLQTSDNDKKKLTKLEEEFVESAVRWAFGIKRYAGKAIKYDTAGAETVVAEAMNSRRYHWIGKKGIGGTGHKSHTIYAGESLARAILPLEEHQMVLARVPRYGIEFAHAKEYFRQVTNRYSGTEISRTTEWIDALGMLPPNVREPKEGKNLNYDEINQYLVAVRVTKEMRTLGVDYGEYILLPRTHIQGDLQGDDKDPKVNFYGLKLTLSDLIRLRLKDYDDSDSEAAKGFYDGWADKELDLRQMIIVESVPDGISGKYITFTAQGSNARDMAMPASEQVKLAGGGKIRLYRRPIANVFREQVLTPVRKFGRISLPRLIPSVGPGRALEEEVAVSKAEFSNFSPQQYKRIIGWLEGEVFAELNAEGGFASAFGKEGATKTESGTGVAGAFQSVAKYLVDQTILNNPARSVDPETGKILDEPSRSLLAIRRVVRDTLEILYKDNKWQRIVEVVDGKAVEIPKSDAFFNSSKLIDLITKWEENEKIPKEKRDHSDSELEFAIRVELFFILIDLILSNYRHLPLPSSSKLHDYWKLNVQTAVTGLEPLGVEEVFKIQELVVEYLYDAAHLEKEVRGKSFDLKKFIPKEPNDQAAFGYCHPNHIRERLRLMMERHGLVGSFEWAVLVHQYNARKRATIPTQRALHDEKKKEEKKA